MRKVILLTVLGAVLFLSTATGFDGKRKGFVLGGGAGLAPWVHWKIDKTEPVDFSDIVDLEDEGAGGCVSVLIGYAFDERNMLVWEAEVAFYEKDFEWVDITFTQGFAGATWYHYFGRSGNSFFTAVGLGTYHHESEFYENREIGGGMKLGVGWEFSRHVQAGLYLTGGMTTLEMPGFSADFKHGTLSLAVTGVAF